MRWATSRSCRATRPDRRPCQGARTRQAAFHHVWQSVLRRAAWTTDLDLDAWVAFTVRSGRSFSLLTPASLLDGGDAVAFRDGFP